MNVIITGASGLLGRAVVTEFKQNSWKVLGLAHTRVRDDLVQIDITDIHAVSSIVREFKPHAIIHCAAEKSPDKIERHPEESFRLNVSVPEDLAKLADEVKAVFVFISSDYVFSGKNPPYSEDDSTNPINTYGLYKVTAERAAVKANPGSCILRIPVLYGGEETVGESAISSLINAVKSKSPMRVSTYETRYPIHTSDIAAVIYQLVQRKLQDPSLVHNVYHWCGTEPFTKFEMAKIIAVKFAQSHDHLIPLNDPTPGASRPRNTHLRCERLESLGIGRHTTFEVGIEDFRKFFQ